MQCNEFPGETMRDFRVAGSCPPSLDPHLTRLSPAELLQGLTECSDVGLPFRVAVGIAHQHADPTQSFDLLRACRKGPSDGRSRNSFEEITSPHCPAQSS